MENEIETLVAAAITNVLPDAITKALDSGAITPPKDDAPDVKKEISDQMKALFAPNVSKTAAKRDPGSALGAMVALTHHSGGNKAAISALADAHYGETHPIVKALQSNVAGGAAEAVAIDIANEMVDVLRAESVVRQIPGVRFIRNDDRREMRIPKFLTGTGISWLAEGAKTNATQPTTGFVSTTPRKAHVKVPLTVEMLAWSNPDMEAAVSQHVLAEAAVGTDLAYLRGAAGGPGPTGIANLIAAGNKTPSAGISSANVEADVGGLIEAVEGNNIRGGEGSFAFLGSTRTKNAFRMLRDSVSGAFLFPEMRLGKGDNLMGYDFKATNNIPNNLGGGGDESEFYFVHGPSVIIRDAFDEGGSVEVLDNVAYTDSAGNLVSGVDDDTVLVKLTLFTDSKLLHAVGAAMKTGAQYGA